MKRLPRGKCVFRWIAAKLIDPDPQVQRHFIESHAKAIAADFDANTMPPLDVEEQPRKGRFYCFAGQHRLAGVIEVYGKEIEVPCQVWSGLSIAEKAKMVILGEKKRNWNPVDKWRVRRIKRDPVVADVDKILESHGLTVDMASTDGIVSAIDAVERTYKQLGGDVLDSSLSTIRGAWGMDRLGFNGHIIRGIGFVLAKYNGEVNPTELSKRLSKYVTPLTLIGRARGYREAVKVTMDNAVATEVVRIFNRGRSTKKLSPWGV